MKTTVGDLRKLIREEYLRGVPEFVFREAVSDFIEDIKRHVTTFVNVHKADNFIEKKQAIESMQDALDKLETEVNAQVEDALWSFIQNV